MSSKKRCAGSGDPGVLGDDGAARGEFRDDDSVPRRVSSRRERQAMLRTARDIYRRPIRCLGTRNFFDEVRRSGRKRPLGSGEGSGCIPAHVEPFHSVPNVALVSARSLDCDDASRRHRRRHRRRHATRCAHALLDTELASFGSRTSRLTSSGGAGDLAKERQLPKLLQVSPGFTIEVSVDMPWTRSNSHSASIRAPPRPPSEVVSQTPDATMLALPGATGDAVTCNEVPKTFKCDPPAKDSDVNSHVGEDKCDAAVAEVKTDIVQKDELQISENGNDNKATDMIDTIFTALMKFNLPSGANQVSNQASPQECFVVWPQYASQGGCPSNQGPVSGSTANMGPCSHATPGPAASASQFTWPHSLAQPPQYPDVPPQTSPFNIHTNTSIPPSPYDALYPIYPPTQPFPSPWGVPHPPSWPQVYSPVPRPTDEQPRVLREEETGGNEKAISSSAASSNTARSQEQFASMPYALPRFPPWPAQDFPVPRLGGYPSPYSSYPGVDPMSMGYVPTPYHQSPPYPYPMEPEEAAAQAFRWAAGSTAPTAATQEVANAPESERVAAQVIRGGPRAKRGRRWRLRRHEASASPASQQDARNSSPRHLRSHSASASRLYRTRERSSSTVSPSPTVLRCPLARREGRQRRRTSSSELFSSLHRRARHHRSSSTESEQRSPQRKAKNSSRKAPVPPELASAWKMLEFSSTVDDSSGSSDSETQSEVVVEIDDQDLIGRWIQASRHTSGSPHHTMGTGVRESELYGGHIAERPDPSKLPATDNLKVTRFKMDSKDDGDGTWERVYFGKRRRLDRQDNETDVDEKERGKDFELTEFQFLEKDLYAAWHHTTPSSRKEVGEEPRQEIQNEILEKCVECVGCEDEDKNENHPKTSSSSSRRRSSQCSLLRSADGRRRHKEKQVSSGESEVSSQGSEHGSGKETEKESSDDLEQRFTTLRRDTIALTKLKLSRKSLDKLKQTSPDPKRRKEKKQDYTISDSRELEGNGSEGVLRSSEGHKRERGVQWMSNDQTERPQHDERSKSAENDAETKRQRSKCLKMEKCSKRRSKSGKYGDERSHSSEESGDICEICDSSSLDSLQDVQLEASRAKRLGKKDDKSPGDYTPKSVSNDTVMYLKSSNVLDDIMEPDDMMKIKRSGETEYVLYADDPQLDLSDIEGDKRKSKRKNESGGESDDFSGRLFEGAGESAESGVGGSMRRSAGVRSVSIKEKGKDKKRKKKCRGGKTYDKKKSGRKVTTFKLAYRKRNVCVCIRDPLHISMVRHSRIGATPYRGLGPPRYRYLYQNWICPCCRKGMCLSELGLYDPPPFKAQRLPRWLRARIARRATELDKRYKEAEEFRQGEEYLRDPYGAYYNQGYDTCDATKNIPCHVLKKYPKHGPCTDYKGFKRREVCICGQDISSEESATSSETRRSIRFVMRKLKARYTGESLFKKKHRTCHPHESCRTHPVSYETSTFPCPVAPCGRPRPSGVCEPQGTPPEPAGKISTLIPSPFDGLQRTPWVLPFQFKYSEPCYVAAKGKLCPYCHRRSHLVHLTPFDQPHEIKVCKITNRSKEAASISMVTSGTPYHVRCCCCNRHFFGPSMCCLRPCCA